MEQKLDCLIKSIRAEERVKMQLEGEHPTEEAQELSERERLSYLANPRQSTVRSSTVMREGDKVYDTRSAARVMKQLHGFKAKDMKVEQLMAGIRGVVRIQRIFRRRRLKRFIEGQEEGEANWFTGSGGGRERMCGYF